VTSWYDSTRLLQTTRGEDQPITLTTYTPTGRVLSRLPLTDLPGTGRGRTDIYIAKINPRQPGRPHHLSNPGPTTRAGAGRHRATGRNSKDSYPHRPRSGVGGAAGDLGDE